MSKEIRSRRSLWKNCCMMMMMMSATHSWPTGDKLPDLLCHRGYHVFISSQDSHQLGSKLTPRYKADISWVNGTLDKREESRGSRSLTAHALAHFKHDMRSLPYFCRGQVVHGFGRGSKDLGIPTGETNEKRNGEINPKRPIVRTFTEACVV